MMVIAILLIVCVFLTASVAALLSEDQLNTKEIADLRNVLAHESERHTEAVMRHRQVREMILARYDAPQVGRVFHLDPTDFDMVELTLSPYVRYESTKEAEAGWQNLMYKNAVLCRG